jgi:hypothetical protein
MSAIFNLPTERQKFVYQELNDDRGILDSPAIILFPEAFPRINNDPEYWSLYENYP